MSIRIEVHVVSRSLPKCFLIVSVLLILGSCAEQGTVTSRVEEHEALKEDLRRAQQDRYSHLEDDALATSSAQFEEDMRFEAWTLHVEAVLAEGQVYAGDPSVNQDPEVVDCDDFDYQEEAVAFFWGAGGPEVDPFWLDDDRDEVPCELPPRWQPGDEWDPRKGAISTTPDMGVGLQAPSHIAREPSVVM